MFELTGKHNTCKVFTDNADNETISQLMNLLNQQSISDSCIRIMPDTHAGKGCVIGTTMTLTDKVIPNLVGVDIGCGMLAIKIANKKADDIDCTLLDDIIHKYVPAGFTIHEHPIVNVATMKSQLHQINAPIDENHALKSLGTLGGGNHFIELDYDSDENVWLVIHTGSRHLGLEVCKYYQDLAYKTIRNNGIKEKIDATVAKLKSERKQHEIENTIKVLKMQNGPIPKDLCHVTGQDFEDYIHDMQITQQYAAINRETIAKIILKQMNWGMINCFHTIHNYIDTEHMILRKGAVSARKDEQLIIPMNMRDGSLLCVGKGNPDWNYSAPHGAGRIMSRGQAKELVSMKEYEQSMSGIYTTSVTTSTIDESPMVYKPMNEIMTNVRDTVSIVDVIKPIYNFKAS